MHAEPTTIGRAFPVRKQHAIPSYQRNYVWTRAGQWEPLWDDLRGLSRQTLTKGPVAKPHFLGTIINDRISMVTLCGDIAQARLLEEPTQQGWRPL